MENKMKTKEKRDKSENMSVPDFCGLSEIIPGALNEIRGRHCHEDLRFNDIATIKVYLQSENEKVRKMLEKTIKGKTVLDLGAGKRHFGAYEVSRWGAKNYVGVEPNFADGLKDDLSWAPGNMHRSYEDRNLPYYNDIERMHVSETDMLYFLERLPKDNDNVVALMSGIDRCILSGDSQEYVSRIWKELRRILPEKGRLISSSYCGFTPRPKDGFKHFFCGQQRNNSRSSVDLVDNYGYETGAIKFFEKTK